MISLLISLRQCTHCIERSIYIIGKCIKSIMDDQEVLNVYGSDDNPLSYMIEPKGSVDIIDKDEETTKEDLEPIL